MSYRCVYIKKAKQLSLKDNCLIANTGEKEISVPLEDISMILLEDNKCSITTKLISALASSYIGLIVSDDKYMPSSLTLPLYMHYKQLKVFELQMNVKKPVYSQLWVKIIQQKIKNQIAVLQQTSNDEFYLSKIYETMKTIKSNDKTNREAVAAKYFFTGVYGELFTRKRKSEDEINAALNYGYTILMSCMERMLVMYGFNTILGIHHESYSNNFNLACDLMEPFRPIVDQCVFNSIDELTYPLSSDTKIKLVSLLTSSVRLNSKTYLVEHAMEEVVLSYIKVLEKEDSSLLSLPEIIDKNIDWVADND